MIMRMPHGIQLGTIVVFAKAKLLRHQMGEREGWAEGILMKVRTQTGDWPSAEKVF
jgi:hypothetical protein